MAAFLRGPQAERNSVRFRLEVARLAATGQYTLVVLAPGCHDTIDQAFGSVTSSVIRVRTGQEGEHRDDQQSASGFPAHGDPTLRAVFRFVQSDHPLRELQVDLLELLWHGDIFG